MNLKTKKRVAIFISGKGSNMMRIIEQSQTGVLHNTCDVVCVLANTDKAEGIALAANFGITTHIVDSYGMDQSEFETKVLEYLQPLELDYIVLAGFMKVLSANFIAHYPHRIINIHPADTSLHRGLHAYEWAFKKRLKQTYVTIHYIDEGIDSGQVIKKFPVDLSEVKTLDEVKKRGLAVEHAEYSKILNTLFLNH